MEAGLGAGGATVGMRLAAGVLVLSLTPLLAGQTDPRTGARIHGESNRLVKLLEIESERGESARRLLELGSIAVPDLARGLADPRIEVVRIVSHILRRLGPEAKEALPALREMADEKDPDRAYLARWAMAKIHTTGTTLIADYGTGAIVEFDSAGKKVHEVEIGQVWSAERLANGNYLVGALDIKGVREIDRRGREVWKYEAVQRAMDVERLPDGNTLIADFGGNRVIEVDSRGKVVWTYESKAPYDADRLPNGNTLVADYNDNSVVEVTPEGNTVWEYEEATGILSAERLPCGNTLMALYTARRVEEVDVTGKVVWKIALNFNPDTAYRLPNGNTLVGGENMLVEYDSQGETISTFRVGRAASIDRY